MRKESWAELMTDEEHAGWMIPVLSLYHEHDENPETRPGPIGPERREQIIAGMAAGIVGAYRYFRPHRQARGRRLRQRTSERHSQDWEERSVPVRFWQEIQALLRRRDDTLAPKQVHQC